ncbi:MAG: hypothetical protein LBJ02_12010 [Bifidobacteriaceae bacterium]|nr:hypothetical protein [Bifidobacteriaceae bacterium]
MAVQTTVLATADGGSTYGALGTASGTFQPDGGGVRAQCRREDWCAVPGCQSAPS